MQFGHPGLWMNHVSGPTLIVNAMPIFFAIAILKCNCHPPGIMDPGLAGRR